MHSSSTNHSSYIFTTAQYHQVWFKESKNASLVPDLQVLQWSEQMAEELAKAHTDLGPG